MSYTLIVTSEADYLHAVVTGTNSKENVTSYLADIIGLCTTRQCFRVLIEERLEGPRLSMMDVFDIAAGGGRLGPIEAIAYVDVNAVGDLMRFAEDVAVNRGMPVRIFPTVGEAKAWISSES
jgi:hypothetical protein